MDWIKKHKLLTAIGIVIILIAIANSGSDKPAQKPEASKPTKAVEQKVSAAFDVPSLVGKNVDEITTELKPYQQEFLAPTQAQIDAGVDVWDTSFSKDGQALLVNYNIATKKVDDFFISTDGKSGKTKDKQRLLQVGNLKESDPRYKVEFVKVITEPSYYTGIKIVPSR